MLTVLYYFKTLVCFHLLVSNVIGYFEDVTELVLHTHSGGIIAAFGDFNSDKLTDVIVIQPDNTTVEVLLAKNEKDKSSLLKLKNLNIRLKENNVIINNVYSGDFNADSKMDLMLFCKNTSDDTYLTKMHFGQFDHFQEEKKHNSITNIKNQPLQLDFNGDMIPDLLAENKEGVCTKWIITTSDETNLRIISEKFPNNKSSKTFDSLWEPTSSAFVDINNDLVADIIIATGDTRPVFEEWLNVEGVHQYNGSHSLDVGAVVFGRSLYIDIDSDGHLEHVLPVCMDSECKQSAIYYFSFTNRHWYRLASPSSSFQHVHISWGFSPPDVRDHLLAASMTLHAGDYNLDGFVDVLCILQKEVGRTIEKRVFVLENVDCDSPSICNGSRALNVMWDLSEPFRNITDPLVTAFYDLGDDGILDIIISGKKQTYIYRNMLSEDASFLKVLVTSGRCDANCDGRTPYGTSQPGPTIKYSTIRYDGSWQTGIAPQLSQNAFFALELPYVTFGLGRTPNFIEKLTIGIPKTPVSGNRVRTWEQIIPNSQIVIIPYPLDQPSSWTEKLFAAPSHFVVATAGTLIGTCIFISIIIGILHWREKKADRREKLEEAQRFHFDAM